MTVTSKRHALEFFGERVSNDDERRSFVLREKGGFY